MADRRRLSRERGRESVLDTRIGTHPSTRSHTATQTAQVRVLCLSWPASCVPSMPLCVSPSPVSHTHTTLPHPLPPPPLHAPGLCRPRSMPTASRARNHSARWTAGKGRATERPWARAADTEGPWEGRGAAGSAGAAGGVCGLEGSRHGAGRTGNGHSLRLPGLCRCLCRSSGLVARSRH